MKDQKIVIEELFKKVENYTKTTFELHKLKFIGKSSSVVSIVLLYVTLFIIALFFVSFINIALALLIGKWIGIYYLGFLIVSIFYLFIACLVFIFKDEISQKLQDTILLKILITQDNEDEDEE